MTDWELKPCLCQEGKRRQITRSTAKAWNFCGNGLEGFCPKWAVCHDDPSKPVALLEYYIAAIRLEFEWHYYQILAYTKAQAINLLRKEVGYDKSLGKDDFAIRYMRTLTRAQTLENKRCRIRERERD